MCSFKLLSTGLPRLHAIIIWRHKYDRMRLNVFIFGITSGAEHSRIMNHEGIWAFCAPSV